MTHLRKGPHRRLTALAVALALASLAGCANDRTWGAGAAGGFLVGTGAGVAVGIAAAPGDGTEKTGVVLGSALGGAILGTLVGHYLFDPPKAPPQAPPPPESR